MAGPWDNVQLAGPPNGPAYINSAMNAAQTLGNLVNNGFNQYQNQQNFQYQQQQRDLFNNPQNQQLLQDTLQRALPGQQTYADFLKTLIQSQGASGATSILPLLTQQQSLNTADRVANGPPNLTAPAAGNVPSITGQFPGRSNKPNYPPGAPYASPQSVANNNEGPDTTRSAIAELSGGADVSNASIRNYATAIGAKNSESPLTPQQYNRLRQIFRRPSGDQEISSPATNTNNPVQPSGTGDQQSERISSTGNQITPVGIGGSPAMSPRQGAERNITRNTAQVVQAPQAAPNSGGYAAPSEAEIRRYEASGNRNIAASRTPGLSKEQADAYRNQGDQDRETAKQLRKEREEWARQTDPAIIGAAAAKTAAEEQNKKDIDTLSQYADAGVEARGHVAQLDTISKLGDKVGYGVVPKVQSFLGKHGVETTGLSDIQAYERAIDYMAPQLRPIGSGRLMQQELAAFKSSLGGLMTTPEGRKISVENLKLIGEWKGRIGQIASDTRLSPQDRLSKIYNLDPPHLKTMDDIASNRGGGQAPVPGARQAPDGKWYVSDPNRAGKYLEVRP